MEHRDHRHEHVVHRHVGRGGDERTGFRHAFQSPCAHFAVPPHDEVAARQQASRRLRILRFDFRGVGLARSGREIMGGIDQMMLRRELRHLRVAQRFHGGTWRRFSFGCHGFHCATARRYGTQTVESQTEADRSFGMAARSTAFSVCSIDSSFCLNWVNCCCNMAICCDCW